LYKFRDFLFGARQFNRASLSISLAASWAWGVSIIVGIQVFQNKGLGAFLIWGLANALALSLFGCATSKVSTAALRLSEIIPARLKKVYDSLTILIQFFCLLVNIVAIKTAFGLLEIGGLWWLALCVVIFLAVLARGFDVTVRNNMLFFGVWVSILLAAVISHLSGEFAFKPSAAGELAWGAYGALILLCGPILDQQMWQHRAAACQGGFGTKPFYLASVLFAFYMALIALVAGLSASTNLIIALIILAVAGTTLVSALSAISTFFKSLAAARTGMSGIFCFASVCAALDVSVLQWWTAYGTLRIPFALFAFAVIAWRGEKNK
jgi:hypothetical protein